MKNPQGSDVLVTGGLGFIGSAFVRGAVAGGRNIHIVDLDTYAGDERRLEEVAEVYVLHRMGVESSDLSELVARLKPETIVHFAAESHVTRSESDSDRFFRTNVEGTRNVLQAAERAGTSLVVHVSTDEVYGPCPAEPFKEEDKEAGEGRATSAYARSKALADDAARSFADRVPLIVVRPTNCFGPWQHPEKAIPRWITRVLRGERLPVWGDGRQIRDWMFVEDACSAIEMVMEKGKPGEVYNIAPEGSQVANIDIAIAVARSAGADESSVYLTEYDRPDHDRRYAVDASKLRSLGWGPERGFEDRLGETLQWYRDNETWWKSLLDEAESIYDDAVERQRT